MKLLCLVNTVTLSVVEGTILFDGVALRFESDRVADREGRALTTPGECVVAGLCSLGADSP